MLPREKKFPEECQKVREETLALIFDGASRFYERFMNSKGKRQFNMPGLIALNQN